MHDYGIFHLQQIRKLSFDIFHNVFVMYYVAKKQTAGYAFKKAIIYHTIFNNHRKNKKRGHIESKEEQGS